MLNKCCLVCLQLHTPLNVGMIEIIYSGTPLMRTPLGPSTSVLIGGFPYFRKRERVHYCGCPYFMGVLKAGFHCIKFLCIYTMCTIKFLWLFMQKQQLYEQNNSVFHTKSAHIYSVLPIDSKFLLSKTKAIYYGIISTLNNRKNKHIAK